MAKLVALALSGRMTAIDMTPPVRTMSGALLRGAGAILVAITWISAMIFGAYILAHYGGAVQDGALDRWNKVLPRLYEPGAVAAMLGIGLHFAAGAVLLLAGPVQLLSAIRDRVPALHRWTGRIYVTCALVAGLGGLSFILLKGTIGGMAMNIGFGLYGALMAICAAQTLRYALARDLDTHRAWAVRLFALAIGSWLYRMDYGFWSLLTNDAGHTKDFRGWFDVVMAFFFYVPNLLVAELFIRGREAQAKPWAKGFAAVVLLAAAGFVGLGTYYFTLYAWGPGILARFS